MNTILAPISVGELIDKITILEIKLELLTDPAKLANVQTELTALMTIAETVDLELLAAHKDCLKRVNTELWHIENYKRACEISRDFGADFVSAARQVYQKNDIRAQIKRRINDITHSGIVEEKSHSTV